MALTEAEIQKISRYYVAKSKYKNMHKITPRAQDYLIMTVMVIVAAKIARLNKEKRDAHYESFKSKNKLDDYYKIMRRYQNKIKKRMKVYDETVLEATRVFQGSKKKKNINLNFLCAGLDLLGNSDYTL